MRGEFDNFTLTNTNVSSGKRQRSEGANEEREGEPYGKGLEELGLEEEERGR